jgi:hypothetical protein
MSRTRSPSTGRTRSRSPSLGRTRSRSPSLGRTKSRSPKLDNPLKLSFENIKEIIKVSDKNIDKELAEIKILEDEITTNDMRDKKVQKFLKLTKEIYITNQNKMKLHIFKIELFTGILELLKSINFSKKYDGSLKLRKQKELRTQLMEPLPIKTTETTEGLTKMEQESMRIQQESLRIQREMQEMMKNQASFMNDQNENVINLLSNTVSNFSYELSEFKKYQTGVNAQLMRAGRKTLGEETYSDWYDKNIGNVTYFDAILFVLKSPLTAANKLILEPAIDFQKEYINPKLFFLWKFSMWLLVVGLLYLFFLIFKEYMPLLTEIILNCLTKVFEILKLIPPVFDELFTKLFGDYWIFVRDAPSNSYEKALNWWNYIASFFGSYETLKNWGIIKDGKKSKRKSKRKSSKRKSKRKSSLKVF